VCVYKGKGKVKVKLSLCLNKHHAMNTHWGSVGIAPRILDLGTRYVYIHIYRCPYMCVCVCSCVYVYVSTN
jgi:hypothetical protein